MMRGMLIRGDTRWFCRGLAVHFAFIETTGDQELAIGCLGEAMNGRNTVHRVDNLVRCRIDDNDLALTTQRYIHKRLCADWNCSKQETNQTNPS